MHASVVLMSRLTHYRSLWRQSFQLVTWHLQKPSKSLGWYYSVTEKNTPKCILMYSLQNVTDY